jgi:hypothetical protein
LQADSSAGDPAGCLRSCRFCLSRHSLIRGLVGIKFVDSVFDPSVSLGSGGVAGLRIAMADPISNRRPFISNLSMTGQPLAFQRGTPDR